MPRSAPSVTSGHQVSVASLDAGATTQEMIKPSARSRSAQAGPSRSAMPSLTAIASTAATCPCGSDRVIVIARPAGRDQRGALQRRLDRSDCLLAQPGQVRQGLVLHLAGVAVGVPQVGRLVLAVAALLNLVIEILRRCDTDLLAGRTVLPVGSGQDVSPAVSLLRTAPGSPPAPAAAAAALDSTGRPPAEPPG